MEQGRLFRGVQPDDFKRLLELWGIAANFTPDGEPVLQARSSGVPFLVRFHVPCTRPFSKFEVVTLETTVDVEKGKAVSVANEVTVHLWPLRAAAVGSSRVWLTAVLVA